MLKSQLWKKSWDRGSIIIQLKPTHLINLPFIYMSEVCSIGIWGWRRQGKCIGTLWSGSGKEEENSTCNWECKYPLHLRLFKLLCCLFYQLFTPPISSIPTRYHCLWNRWNQMYVPTNFYFFMSYLSHSNYIFTLIVTQFL